jgi:hypothetical protein
VSPQVGAVRFDRSIVEIRSDDRFEPRLSEAERQAASAAEQVRDLKGPWHLKPPV